MNYFVPLGIFMRQGRRTQSYQNHWRSIATVQLELLDFPFKKKGTLPPAPTARTLCGTLKKKEKRIPIKEQLCYKNTHYNILLR